MAVAKALVLLGLLLLAAGLLLWFWPQAFSWFGKLPGDINYERNGVRVFIPITSMLLLSFLLSLALNLVLWFLRRQS